MLLGSYKIIKNGKCVAHQDNLVTTVGKDMILKFLGSSIVNWAEHLAVGIGNTAAAVSDSSLNFEVARNTVLLKSPNIMTSTATYSSGASSYQLVITLPSSGTNGSFGNGTIGTVANNSAKITGITSTAGMVVGGRINATNGTGNIGTNAIITEVVGPDSIRISADNGTMTAGTITSIKSAYVVKGMAISGTGIDTATVVTNVTSTNTTTTITLSHIAGSGTTGTLTFTQRKLIFKTSLDPTVVTTINEIGLFSDSIGGSSGIYSTDILTRFDEGTVSNNTYWSSGTSVTTSYVGTYSINISNSSGMLGGTIASPQKPGIISYIDLSVYNPADTIKLAFFNSTGSAQSNKAITITFYDTQNDPTYGAGYMQWSIPASPSVSYPTGLNLVSAQLSTLNVANNFNYKVSAILVSTTGNFIFDAMKIDRFLGVNPTQGLISRTVLSSPVTKAAGDNLEIQYELVLGL